MSWLLRKNRLHVPQIKGCQEVSPPAGCSPILAALLVALLCSSSCSLLLVLLSRPLCHFCLHSALSCASVYQVLSSMSNFLRSFLTLSRHLIFVPCRGRGWGNQPNSTFLGTLSPSILARCPSQRRRLAVMVSSSESSIPNRLAIWMLVILSVLCCSDVMPRIPLRHRLWNDSSFLVMLRVVVQVSDPYNNTPKTTALYTNLLVVRDRFLSLNTGSFSIPKAREALAILSQTSFSTPPLASTTDPRYILKVRHTLHTPSSQLQGLQILTVGSASNQKLGL